MWERVEKEGGRARTHTGAVNRTRPSALLPCQGARSTLAPSSQIGENEAAFPEAEQQAVEETYDAVQPYNLHPQT